MEMRQYVLRLLTDYKRMKQEIALLEFELRNLEVTRPEEILEAMVFGSSNDERVAGGSISDRTPEIAQSYQNRFDTLKAESMRLTLARISELKTILTRLDYQLDRLTAYHAALLREHYIDGYSWSEMAGLRCVSKTTLLKQKEIAIALLCEMYTLLEQMGLLNLPSEQNDATV